MKKFLILLLLSIVGYSSFAQYSLKKANRKFNKAKYSAAIPAYKKFLSIEEYRYNIEAMRNLAYSYKKTNQLFAAEQLYAKLHNMDSNWTDLVNYVEVLVQNKKYDKAYKLVNTAEVINRKDQRMARALYTLQNLNQLTSSDTNNVKISLLPLNSEQSDFATSLFQNGILFSKSSLSTKKLKPLQATSLKIKPELYTSTSSTGFKDQQKFASYLKVKGNIGQASYHAKSRTIYYTVDNSPKSVAKNPTHISIHTANFSLEKNEWINTNVFHYNSKYYSCAQPFVSADGSKLYFCSNMPGGYGGMDIYVCNWKDGNWSKAINLGPKINTSGNESYPFVDQSSNLYFSSDARGGLGGTDIFLINLLEPNAQAENLGAPFNSYAEDFAFIKYPSAQKGFFSSTRGKENYDADIYSFERLKAKTKYITIRAIDDANGKNIDSLKLSMVITGSTDTSKLLLTNGVIKNIEVFPNELYEFNVTAENYETQNQTIFMNSLDTVYDFKLHKVKEYCVISGMITNKSTGKKIQKALVTLTNTQNEEESYSSFTNIFGYYTFAMLPKDAIFELSVTADNCFSSSRLINTFADQCFQKINIKPENQYNFALFSGVSVRIEKIYFDLNKTELRTQSKLELDKLVKMMNDNPEIIIELSSHTDARGGDKFNKQLSQRRSEMCVKYMISKGIDKSRIVAKGYGENVLLNKCSDNVPCTEEEHQKNRRTEFQVVGFR